MKKSKKMMRIFRNGVAIVFVLSLIPISMHILGLIITWVAERFPVFGLFVLFISTVVVCGMLTELFRDPDDEERDEEKFWKV